MGHDSKSPSLFCRTISNSSLAGASQWAGVGQ